MTKAAQILELYANGMTVRAIAETVGCRPEYVRVVARQRKGTGRSANDKRYLRSSLSKETRKAYSKRISKKHNARCSALYKGMPADERRRISRAAYAQARQNGKTENQARAKAIMAVRAEAKKNPHCRAAAWDAYRNAPMLEVSP